MNTATMDQVAEQVLHSLTLSAEGKLVMEQKAYLAIGKQIHESDDKQGWSTALIALATRLKKVPGGSNATERVAALAAIALGDVELNGMLCRELYGARGKPG